MSSHHYSTEQRTSLATLPTKKKKKVISQQYFKLTVTQKKFINNTIRASQLPRQTTNNDNTENQEQTAPLRINLPYVQELKRIFNDHNINCTFYTTTTLRTLLSHAKDPVSSEQRNNNVYKYDCKECEAVYSGESKRTIAERTKEHTRAVRAADTRRYETADHCSKYNHDFDWENKKIMDNEANATTRKIKETIHSLSNNNIINRISYRLLFFLLFFLPVKE